MFCENKGVLSFKRDKKKERPQDRRDERDSNIVGLLVFFLGGFSGGRKGRGKGGYLPSTRGDKEITQPGDPCGPPGA